METREEKIKWLEKADSEKLLRQLISLDGNNSFGKYDEDIELTKAEILKRMAAYKERS